MLRFALGPAPMHDPHLVPPLAVGLVAASVRGCVAKRLGLSPIAGCLLVGAAVGPHAPGPVADTEVAAQLAESGIARLMSGVGLHLAAGAGTPA